MTLERYSDSAAGYVLLDSENQAVYKQLYRAAKAKLKLRIKASSSPPSSSTSPEPVAASIPQPVSERDSPSRHNYLDTVLSSPIPNTMPTAAEAPQSVSVKAGSEESDTSSRALPVEKQNITYALRFPGTDNIIGSFCIDCNNCQARIPAEHYHCSICQDGDYDLCLACVSAGVTCPGEDHWLLKRLVRDSVVINSTTETIAPKRVERQETSAQTLPENTRQPEIADKKPTIEAGPTSQENSTTNERTCNACFRGMLNDLFSPG